MYSDASAQILDRAVFQGDVAVEAQTALACGTLGLDAHLDRLFHRQMEQAHHVEVLAVQGVVGAEHIAHADDLQPGLLFHFR